MAEEEAKKRRMTYAEVADRIEEEFGERPTYTMLRFAVSSPSTKKVAPGLTTGLPAPVSPPGKGVRFSAKEIEDWIAHHPRRRHEQLMRSIIEAPPERRDQVVITARDEGLSWEAIAQAVSTATGTTYTKQGAQKKYGRRLTQGRLTNRGLRRR